jgi:hypothetical protein
VYIKLVVLLRNYVTMMHGQQNIKNGWATIVVVGRLRVKVNMEVMWRSPLRYHLSVCLAYPILPKRSKVKPIIQMLKIHVNGNITAVYTTFSQDLGSRGICAKQSFAQGRTYRPLKKHLGMECLITDLTQDAQMKTHCSPSYQFTQISCDAVTLYSVSAINSSFTIVLIIWEDNK